MNKKQSKCKHENMQVMLDLIIQFPFSYWGNITKENLRKKEFKLWGADWSNASFSCPDCGFVYFPK